MKKSLFYAGIGVAMSLVAVSCSKKDNSNVDPNEITTEQTDSLSMCFGKNVAMQAREMLANDTTVDRRKVLKVMQTILGHDIDNSTLAALYFTYGLANEIASGNQNGIEYNKVEMFNAFKSVFLADSLSEDEAKAIQEDYFKVNAGVQAKLEAKKAADKANAPEAIQNVKTGEAYVNKVKANDPEVKTTESGISYKIVNPGEGVKATENDVVSFIYEGRFTDGSVFDSSDGQSVQAPIARLVPGMGESLKMLGKGGKGTFYIPGELAYGVDGVPQLGIGPNQMLVFDVEIVDIQPME